MRTPRAARPVLCAAVTLGLIAVAIPGAAYAVAEPVRHTTSSPAGLGAALKLSPVLAHARGPQAAFVQLSGEGALAVDAFAKGGRLLGRRQSVAARDRVHSIDTTLTSVTRQARAADRHSHVLYDSRYTVPGVAMLTTAAAYRRLATRSDVVSITPLVPKTVPELPTSGTDSASPQTAGSDIYTQALKAWQQTGRTGTGVHMAIIDTGMDYTHADLGGPGTSSAHAAAYASTAAPQSSWYDPKKYLGGWDFAGATYDATPGTSYDPYPDGDANPIDGIGGGHGSHVAGIAAGYGENADGTTFRGDYANLTPAALLKMKIGPGSAPNVGVYALKVFGDGGGSTDLTGAALDWIGEQLTKGVDINVVNMSLGSDYSAADDPDNAKVAALVAQGVLPVISAGNSGDVTDVGGSPGNTPAALTVAASADGYALDDEVGVTAPQSLVGAGPYLAEYSLDYLDPMELTASVVAPQQASDADGCAPFDAADAARMKGKIVMLSWDEANLACGSADRFDDVAEAGGVGVLLASTSDTFDTGIAGDSDIPGAEITRSAATRMAPALAAGTLQVRLSDTLRDTQHVYTAAESDTLAGFTSRGGHGSYQDSVKPDLASPGVGIVSIDSGTGNGFTVMSGTSMASPHAAGIAALVFEAHPNWTPLHVKADLMNTADHDTTIDGMLAPLQRQGTGRIDALAAVENDVTVASAQDGPLVTASFGVLDVDRPLRRTRTLVVTNSGSAPRTYDVAASSRQALPGVRFGVSPSTVTVAPHGATSVTVTLSIPNPSALRRLRDSTQAATLSSGGARFRRDYVPAATDLITFTPSGASAVSGVPPLRVAAFVAPKPAATMRASAVRFANRAARLATLRLSGHALAQGTGGTGYHSLVAPFVLGATSPAHRFSGPSATTLDGLDIRAVGAASTAPAFADRAKGTLAFGVAMNAPSAEIGGSSSVEIEIDVDDNGTPDFGVYLARSSSTDTAFAETVDLATGNAVAILPAYGVANGVDANIFDSSVVVLTVPLAALGFDRYTRSGALRYRALTQSSYAPSYATTGDPTVDSTRWAAFDAYRPAYSFGGTARKTGTTIVFADRPGTILVHRSAVSRSRLLVLHLHDAPRSQAQLLNA